MITQVVKDYLTELKMKGSSTHTLINYGYHLQKFVDFVQINDIEYTQITSRQVKTFRNYLVEQGLKPKTINTVLGAIKSFYDFLVEEGKVTGNPIVTKRLRVKEGQQLPKFLSEEELEVVHKWLEGVPYHVSLGFRAMLATGLRVSEIAAVLPSDLLKLKSGGYALRVRHGKGDKERYAPVMDGGVARELVEYAARQEGDDTAPLFKITHHTFKGWARKCRQATGVQFHSHRCRHTVGTQLLQSGVPLDKVQDVLGHADISTTRRYAKTAPEAILELAAKVEEVKEERAVYRYYLG